MAGDPPIIYWDTCIFIAWLMRERRNDVSLADLRAWITDFDNGDAKCITSVVTRVEVLDTHTDLQNKQRFAQVFTPPRASMIQVTPPIADLAHGFRDHFKQQGGKTLTTPDALHLATAVAFDASEFHTVDDGRTGRGLGLLEVDPKDLGLMELEIKTPERDQGELELKDE